MGEEKLFSIILPALVGLFGVIIGSTIVSIVNWNLKSKETRLRLFERIFEKKIKSYDEVLELSKYLRSVISTKSVDDNNYLITYPASLQDKNSFEELKWKSYNNTNFNSHWLRVELIKEISLLHDYLVSLENNIQKVNEKYYPEIGKLVKNDFVNFAADIENISLNSLKKELESMNPNISGGSHKYSNEITHERLNNTEMIKNLSRIREFESMN